MGTVGKSDTSQTDEEKKRKLRKSTIKGLARRSREKHAILAEVREDQCALITSPDKYCRGMKNAKFVNKN